MRKCELLPPEPEICCSPACYVPTYVWKAKRQLVPLRTPSLRHDLPSGGWRPQKGCSDPAKAEVLGSRLRGIRVLFASPASSTRTPDQSARVDKYLASNGRSACPGPSRHVIGYPPDDSRAASFSRPQRMPPQRCSGRKDQRPTLFRDRRRSRETGCALAVDVRVLPPGEEVQMTR